MGSAARKLPLPAVPALGDGAANDHDRTRKPALRFFTCGSVDDGKSTLIGRLLYEAGAVLDDQMDTLERDSRRFGTQDGAIDFSLLVDGLSAEREQGITIDVAYRYFATPKRSFVVADTPGHEQYTRNMATGGLDRRPRRDPGRCAPRPAAADPQALHHRLAGRRAQRRPGGQQDGPRRL